MRSPKGWVDVPLLDIAQLHDSKRVPLNSAERAAMPGLYPYFGANGQVDTVGHFLFDGDFILLAEDGGYFDDPTRNVAYEATGKFWVNNHAHILSPEDDIPTRYLSRLLNTINWLRFVSGTTRLKLTQSGMQRISVPLAPLAEQHRIVAKLDALMARLSRARAELDRVPSLTAAFRSRTVRDAYRGRLSARWRMEHGSRHSADDVERNLPAGWRWTTLGQIASIKSGITLGKKRDSNATLVKVPYLRVANVQRGALDLAIIKEVGVTAAEAQALYLLPGDILLNEGGDRDKLGRGWVWSGEIANCIHQNHVFRARLIENANSPKYISYYANEFGQDYFLEHGTQTTNLASISKAKLSALPIPICSPAEQLEIVRLIKVHFARANQLEAEAARACAQLGRLEFAILAKAFRGELVPQDPNDEPASVLLERIRAQRAETPKVKRGRRTASLASSAS